MSRITLLLALALSTQSTLPSAPPSTFRGTTDLVITHVSVTDRRGRFVPNLPQSAFTLYEDGRPQTIQAFTQDDLPATIGLIVDGSASVWPIRGRLISAATSFAVASRPDDELFALAFNEEIHAVPSQQPPNRREFGRLLDRAVVAAGRTALYDALSHGLDILDGSARPRRVLVLVSDGGDNASRIRREEIVRRVEAANVQIYAVALRDPNDSGARPQNLRALTDASGGVTIPSTTDAGIAEALRAIAQDIRHAYTLGYASDRAPDDSLRHIRVDVVSPDGTRLVVRSRNSYRAVVTDAGSAQ